jgi:flagellar hook-basal body complex protein FliE
MNQIILNTQPQELKFPTELKSATSQPENIGSFKDTIKQFVESVNGLQKQAAAAETGFLNGEITDVHQVMVAVEEASVAFELLMEIRNKLLEAYQQVQRMPI